MVSSIDRPRCPVCGHAADDLSELEEGHNTLTCDDCGVEYDCLVTTSVQYDTEELG